MAGPRKRLTYDDLLSVNRKCFWARVTKTETCWIWTGPLSPDGYGRASVPSKRTSTSAHRVAWVLAGRPLDVRLQLDHLCLNRACVNPDHMEPVTPAENTRRSSTDSYRNGRKTHCVHGHELTEENVYVYKHKWGLGRRCRTCTRLHDAARRAA